jgi:hypothetical protein
MSDSPQPATIDNTDTLNPAEPADTPVAAPLATEDPATPLIKEEPVVAAPADPITGSDYTNTSNGNQVAVLSTIDYSTNTVIYNYTITANSTEHNASSNYYGMNGGTATSNSTLSAESPDDVTDVPGNASLQLSLIHI